MASYERKQAGVILYELFVGTPPFYTNSIYSLIHHIVKSPVAFPPDISPEFKGFLAGLLNKDPAQRLAWPVLLHHPFVATHVGKGELEQEHHLERVSLPPNSLNLPTTTVCLPIRLLSMLKIAFFCFFFPAKNIKNGDWKSEVVVVIVTVVCVQDRVMSTSKTSNVVDYTVRPQEESRATTKPTQEAELSVRIQYLIEVNA